ncbi:MBOAT family O-acyltransferase [Granulicella tundricola]|uniref:Membrane bound O-acyl transferase MBOAT family protein n=1 Tax=Granulicella tundricola (strain ATCC BAA-1859 / DSM 23138 / MP5ACTX9) TaxID=1198114 RepID=E8X526_GRATM|nr:MBOAT family O-acyltransferase [Granulicella tundricola]ADW67218.1 membrane bound O-acyl transferase MBOAT family protein [Granulicella tundricola MP5ACTX9]
MLFNSFPFLFIFLPIALLGYQIAGRLHRRGVVVWLGIASLAFYAYWHPTFLIILGISILLNYLIACLIVRRIPNSIGTHIWLALAICANLGALCYFKYLFPFLIFVTSFTHTNHDWGRVLLPLGISFFTFTQIAYLVDLQQNAAELQDFSSYMLFVTFFPHLIAGPILHHKSIMPQFAEGRDYRLNADDVAVGFSWFIMGLFKKVMLADNFISAVDPAFAAPGGVSRLAGLIAILSYALQLYFDFSGYSDMALGLARMFSIQFPLNFASPYKASNIIDFWNRWHMTLTQYITSYVFTPVQKLIREHRQKQGLAVNRKALNTVSGFANMIAIPTLFTMGIAGIWHGAGSRFIIYGLLHGGYITSAHAWRITRTKRPNLIPKWIGQQFRHIFSVGLTFFAVIVSQVFFRSSSTGNALLLLRNTFGFHHSQSSTAALSGFPLLSALALLVLGFIIVWLLPNTQQILINFKPSLALAESDAKPAVFTFRWSPTFLWAVMLSAALVISVSHFQDPSTFLYFQF